MIRDDVAILVKRAQAGERSAYGELAVRFEPTVRSLALARLHNPVEAQELVQEVFVHAMTKLDQLREPAAFAGWIRQITVRMALNRLTRNGPVRQAAGEVLDNAWVAEQTPLDALVRAEACTELLAGLERLRPIDREALVAFYLRGRSLKQMSREFAAPVGTIKRRLHVARQRLRDQLEVAGKRAPVHAPRSNPRPRGGVLAAG